MKKVKIGLMKTVVVFTGCVILVGLNNIGCNKQRQHTMLSSPVGTSREFSNYAQILGDSTIFSLHGEQHQINFVLSNWPAYPYGEWIYAEINEQSSVGSEPGIDQIPVTLNAITFTFSGLSSDMTDILVAIKDKEGTEEHYTEVGRYVIQNGAVSIPVTWEHLISYFGITHYSVWFQIVGGKNGQGIIDGAWIEIQGTASDGQIVRFKKNIRLGTNPPPTPTPIPITTFSCTAGEYSEMCIAGQEKDITYFSPPSWALGVAGPFPIAVVRASNVTFAGPVNFRIRTPLGTSNFPNTAFPDSTPNVNCMPGLPACFSTY